MPAATDRIEFAPPPAPGRLPALVLAVLAHLLLMLALTWGITWNRESQDVAAEAELWASIPQEAAPAPPPPAPAPVVQAPPLQRPAPPPPEPKAEPPAVPKAPDIALEREKRRKEEARQREEAQRQKKLEARRHEQELEREKKLEARRKKEELDKRELAERKAAAEKKRQEELAKAKAKEQADAKRLQALREENIRRMQSMASGTGGPNAAGTAARSAGPSESYAGRIRARVKPNIVFTDDVPGNPTAEVEVRMAPDGTITSKRVVKSSGVRSWDEAVLRALDKTEVLPRDIDGRVHSPLILEFRPKG